MRNSATSFLQLVIVLIGVVSLGLLLWEPHLEGRNAHATLFQIYFKDPFLAYLYIASIAYFVALYHTFGLLDYVGSGNALSSGAVKALRTIKYCAISLAGMLAGAVAYIVIARSGSDDIAGGVMMGLVLVFASAVVATAAAVAEKTLQQAVELKAKSDATR